MVWYELIQKQDDPEVSYRLVPDKFDRVSALNILKQQAQSINIEPPTQAFQKAFNQIPLFMDVQLRVQVDGQAKFPIYLSYQDMTKAVEKASAAVAGYQSAVAVMDLTDLLDQMMRLESEIDFRNAVFVPPSLPTMEDDKAMPTTGDFWAD